MRKQAARSGSGRIESLGITNMAPQWKPSSGGGSVALEVEDFLAAIQQLKSAGYSILLGPFETPVCHMAVVSDPDGNSVTIHKRKASEGREELLYRVSVAEDARALTVESDGHAFDAVGGFDALHERHFAQGFEHLRPLAGVKHLLALDFGEVVEQSVGRSEERRVGKEGRSRWSPY